MDELDAHNPREKTHLTSQNTNVTISQDLNAKKRLSGAKILVIAWISILIVIPICGFLLAVLIIALNPERNVVSPTPVQNLSEKTDSVDTLLEEEYVSTKYGFTIKYPDPELIVEEYDFFSETKKYFDLCFYGISACPSFELPEYAIRFRDKEGPNRFDVLIYTSSVEEYFGGKENDGFTYKVDSEGFDNRYFSSQDLENIENSIRFIPKEKPKICLWKGSYLSFSLDELNEIEKERAEDLRSYLSMDEISSEEVIKNIRSELVSHAGWRYNEGVCEKVENYTWGSRNWGDPVPPFKTQQECMQVCED